MLRKEEFARVYSRHAPLVKTILNRHDVKPELQPDHAQSKIAEIPSLDTGCVAQHMDEPQS